MINNHREKKCLHGIYVLICLRVCLYTFTKTQKPLSAELAFIVVGKMVGPLSKPPKRPTLFNE